MNISNTSGSNAANIENTQSVQNVNNDENRAEINQQVKSVRNIALVLLTLTVAFLVAGLALTFVGAPLVAFLPLFIAAGVTGLLFLTVVPFISNDADTEFLHQDANLDKPQTPQESSAENSDEPSTHHEERLTPLQTPNKNKKLRFQLSSNDDQADNSTTIIDRGAPQTKL